MIHFITVHTYFLWPEIQTKFIRHYVKNCQIYAFTRKEFPKVFDEVLYIKDTIHNKILKGSKLKKGDVLIAIVGATIGQVSIYDYDKEANINQAIALVRLKEGINPEYVKAYMVSTLGQKQLDRIKRF